MKTVIVAGKVVSWVDAVAQMDDALCRTLERLYPCSEQFFADQYSAAHQAHFGRPFEVK